MAFFWHLIGSTTGRGTVVEVEVEVVEVPTVVLLIGKELSTIFTYLTVGFCVHFLS